MNGIIFKMNSLQDNIIFKRIKGGVIEFCSHGMIYSRVPNSYNMNNECIVPKNKMILIGATGRNGGKTTLARQIIKKYKDQLPIIGFKLITVRDHSDVCPRGGKGCGICEGLKGDYDIREELGEGNKDTMLLREAGAKHVYLIRSLKDNLKEALTEALTLVPDNALIVCESNSGRLVLEPSCFVMIMSSTEKDIKPTAKAVIDQADFVLEQTREEFDDFLHNKLPGYLGF